MPKSAKKKQAQRAFASHNFHFRPTSLSEAMQSAGLATGLHLVREPKMTIAKPDNYRERMIPVRHATV